MARDELQNISSYNDDLRIAIVVAQKHTRVKVFSLLKYCIVQLRLRAAAHKILYATVY